MTGRDNRIIVLVIALIARSIQLPPKPPPPPPVSLKAIRIGISEPRMTGMRDAITGIANLNWPSLVATVFFFVGGLAVTWGLGRFLF